MIPLRQIDSKNILQKKREHNNCMNSPVHECTCGTYYYNKCVSELDKLVVLIDVLELAKHLNWLEGFSSKPEFKDKLWIVCKEKDFYIDKAKHLKSTATSWLSLNKGE